MWSHQYGSGYIYLNNNRLSGHIPTESLTEPVNLFVDNNYFTFTDLADIAQWYIEEVRFAERIHYSPHKGYVDEEKTVLAKSRQLYGGGGLSGCRYIP